jgi:hypothetical protein
MVLRCIKTRLAGSQAGFLLSLFLSNILIGGLTASAITRILFADRGRIAKVEPDAVNAPTGL